MLRRATAAHKRVPYEATVEYKLDLQLNKRDVYHIYTFLIV